MQSYEYLIIGGGIAGVTAAETIRGRDTRGRIGIVSDEPHTLYSRVLLPAYLKKRIPRNRLFLRTADDFTKKNIALLLGQEARAIDTRKKEVIFLDGNRCGYEKLLIAGGGRVAPWNEKENERWIWRLQTIEDADRMRASLPAFRHALVAGGSFIALEFLEIFAENKIPCTLLLKGPHFFEHILDPRGGEMLRENFEKQGIRVEINDSIAHIVSRVNPARIRSAGDEVSHGAERWGIISNRIKKPEAAEHPEDLQIAEYAEVFTQAARQITCDAVGLGIGIERRIGWLKDSGILLGSRGVLANEFLETNVSDVFAAGDIAERYDPLRGGHHADGNWTGAFLSGRHAGLVMTGDRMQYRHIPVYSISNLGFQITVVGYCEPDAETKMRIDAGRSRYERFFFKSGMLRGAVLINCFGDKAHLARIIETQSPVDTYGQELTDFKFDVNQIPIVE